MTPYTQEVEEALKWADTFGKWEGVEGIPDRHCAVLAAELRRQSQELERAREALVRAERFVSNVYNFTPTTNGLDMRDTLKFGLELRAIIAALAQPAPEKPWPMN